MSQTRSAKQPPENSSNSISESRNSSLTLAPVEAAAVAHAAAAHTSSSEARLCPSARAGAGAFVIGAVVGP